MQEKPLDLRIQKTHKALIQAFLKLLEEKKFENITVNEICDAAMVRRATFYKHFGDKYEFFTFMVQYIQEDFRRKNPFSKTSDTAIAPYVAIVENMLDFVEHNAVLAESVMGSSVYPILLNLYSEQIVLDVKQWFREDERNGKMMILPADLMAQVYTGALVNIVRWWLSHREQAGKEQMLAQTTKLIEKLYYATEETE